MQGTYPQILVYLCEYLCARGSHLGDVRVSEDLIAISKEDVDGDMSVVSSIPFPLLQLVRIHRA